MCSFWLAFQRILREAFVHAAAEDRVGALAEFGVGVEQAQRGIADRVAAWSGWPERVSREAELPVLVVGAGGAGGDVDFVVVVLARLLVVERRT